MKKYLYILLATFFLSSSVSAGPAITSPHNPGQSESGAGIIGRAVTATLFVSPDGSGADGLTWATAYTTIQDALDAASTDADDCTLIMISPHTTNYDIDTAGDPTWTGNYILAGASRSWAKIKNTHASATSIMKFTGKVMLSKLNFNLGTGSGNGVIITHGGFRIYDCMFVGEDLGGAATALHIDGATAKHGRIYDSDFVGHKTHMTGILLDNASRNELMNLHIHDCLTGIQIIHASSDENFFDTIDIGDCTLGLDLDAGNEQHFSNLRFHGNTVNIDDVVGDHHWDGIIGSFPIKTAPDNFTGINVATGDGADTWSGSWVELRSAGSATKPFRITGIHVEADASEKFRIKLYDGTTTFMDIQVEGEANVNKRKVANFPSGTEFIFNKGIAISAKSKSESAGIDTATVWLEIQEI